jgi:hypothetical protein
MKLASLLLVIAAAAPARAGTAPKIHTVEGLWPTVELACYERMATVTVAYPDEDGKVETYTGSFRVVEDAALAAVPRDHGGAHGRVKLARLDGERAWHVVSFTPDR